MQTQLPIIENLPEKGYVGKPMSKTNPQKEGEGSLQVPDSFMDALNELTADRPMPEQQDSMAVFFETVPESEDAGVSLPQEGGLTDIAVESPLPTEPTEGSLGLALSDDAAGAMDSDKNLVPAAKGADPDFKTTGQETGPAAGLAQEKPIAAGGGNVAISPDLNSRGTQPPILTGNSPADKPAPPGLTVEKDPVRDTDAGAVKGAGVAGATKGAGVAGAVKDGGGVDTSSTSAAMDPHRGLLTARQPKLESSGRSGERSAHGSVSEAAEAGNISRDAVVGRSVGNPVGADAGKNLFSSPGWSLPQEMGADPAGGRDSITPETNAGPTVHAGANAAVEAKTIQAGSPPSDVQWLPKAAQGDLMSQIVDRAVMTLNNGQSEMKMVLKPELLGNVRMQIVTENHHVTVRIIAETPVVRDMIESNLGQLKSDLQNNGLEIDAFDVRTSSDSNREGQDPRHLSPFKMASGNRSERESDLLDKDADPRAGIVNADGTASVIDYFA